MSDFEPDDLADRLRAAFAERDAELTVDPRAFARHLELTAAGRGRRAIGSTGRRSSTVRRWRAPALLAAAVVLIAAVGAAVVTATTTGSPPAQPASPGPSPVPASSRAASSSPTPIRASDGALSTPASATAPADAAVTPVAAPSTGNPGRPSAPLTAASTSERIGVQSSAAVPPPTAATEPAVPATSREPAPPATTTPILPPLKAPARPPASDPPTSVSSAGVPVGGSTVTVPTTEWIDPDLSGLMPCGVVLPGVVKAAADLKATISVDGDNHFTVINDGPDSVPLVAVGTVLVDDEGRVASFVDTSPAAMKKTSVGSRSVPAGTDTGPMVPDFTPGDPCPDTTDVIQTTTSPVGVSDTPTTGSPPVQAINLHLEKVLIIGPSLETASAYSAGISTITG